jgi:ABC-2 type transport system permease protein
MIRPTRILMNSRQGIKIARAEWTRHHREFGSLLTERPVLLVILIGVASALGWLGHSLGRAFIAGQPLPTDALSLFVSAAFIWMVWRSSKYTHVRFERLNPDMLLTTVPARTAALGLLGFVYARLLTTLVVPILGIAIGSAIGFQSPTVAPTVVLAGTCIAVFAAVLGTTSRLAARLVALRLVRARYYRDLLIVFGWIPLIIAAMLLQELSLSLAPLAGLFGALPLAWFVDLALIGAPTDTVGSSHHSLRVFALLGTTVPVFTAATAILARHVWEHDSASSTGTRGSHSLLKTGIVERFVGERIPQAMYTVARERWLMERRVPQGLLSTGYALLFMGVVGFPLVALAGSTTSLLVFFAVTLGLATGVAFTSDPIGTEYRALPMLFTSVTGQQFVGGSLLAATVVGIPLIALVIAPLGVVGPVGFGQTFLIVLLGSAVCTCTAAVATMVGLDVERFNYAPVPFFFTDVPIYAEVGAAAFLRHGLVLAIGVFASIPAFVGTAPPIYEAIAAHGVPTVVVQIGALLLTLLFAAIITRTAFRAAVQRFRDYQLG